LVDPDRPLTPAAARRLAAIEEFSQMGAGFAIAMRDLEIRGAGNILGTQQSGHIAAVGYELYCELLEKTVRRLKRLPERERIETAIDLPGEAWLPRHYVPDMRLKIDLYRRLSRAITLEELMELRRELVDRFGPLPEAAERLLARMELRILAARWGIDAICLEDRYMVFKYRQPEKMRELARLNGKRLRVVDGRSAYLPLGQELTDPDALVSVAKALLLAQ
jgi:transcription-repair coupling factor (superfamily II helicase)